MKYLTRALTLLFVVLAMFASSCSDAGLLLPVDRGSSGIDIKSVSEGAVLMAEDTFEVALDYDEEEIFPDRMIIELIDSNGDVAFSVELGQEEILQLPMPVILPEDMSDGIYTVSVTVFEAEEESATDSSIFFYITEEYEIEAIAAYPQIFYPGGSGLVLADLNIPEASDPFLRWSLGGENVFEGLLSAGADTLQLEVPDKEGVISILLEVFPFGPLAVSQGFDSEQSSEDPFTFSSVISLEAQFFVSSFQEVDEFELGPEEHYFSLFHFRGETVDWGFHGNGGSAEPIGTPTLAIGDTIFGYFLDGTSGFTADEILLPFAAPNEADGEDGEAAGSADAQSIFVLQPFSFSARFYLQTARGDLFYTENSSGDRLFEVGFTESGLAATVGEWTSAPTGTVLEQGYNDLTLTVIPAESTLRLLWFVNGVLVADEVSEYTPLEDPGTGVSVIGGRGGFTGIIDEIGIYHRITEGGSQVDSQVFSRAMERMFGNDLVLAEGFDGTHLPEHLVYDTEAGDYIIAGGSLFLPPGGSVQFDAIPDSFESLSIAVEAAEGAGGLILETDGGEEIIIEIGEESTTAIRLVYDDSGLSLVHGDEVTPVAPLGEAVAVRNLNGIGEFELRSILVLKNQFEE